MNWADAYNHLLRCGYSPREADEAIGETDTTGAHAISDPHRIGTPWLVCDTPHTRGLAASGSYHLEG